MMNRKTTYIGLFLSAAILWGCSKEPTEELTPSDNLYKVGLHVDGALTKGQVTTDPKSILSLGIIGYSTGESNFDEATAPKPSLFNNVHAERTNENDVLSSWSYDPIVYWPSDLEIKNTFFAYSPHQEKFPEGSLSVVTDKGNPHIIYSVPEKISEQIDLLYSDYNAEVTNINYNSNSGKAKFNMKHALLWLRFIIAPVKETTNDGESYTIKEFNMTAGHIINTGKFDMTTAKWSMPDDGDYEAVDYEFDSLWDKELVVQAGEPVPMAGASSTDCMMIIPQDIVRSENVTSVSIYYTHDDGSGSPKNTEYYITMPFPDVKLDKTGCVMTFVVKISASGSWVEFLGSNTIEAWLEDDTQRDIEVF